MNIEIVKASYNDLQLLHKIQVEAFRPLLEKYKDYNTNPSNEIIDQIIRRYNQNFTTYWLIKNHGKIVGGVRVVNKGDRCYRVSPIFIQPLEQGKGMAQKTFKILEDYYYDAGKWELDTILQEKALCYLYEKLGYKKTGKTEEIKEGMTIVYYEKHM